MNSVKVYLLHCKNVQAPSVLIYFPTQPTEGI